MKYDHNSAPVRDQKASSVRDKVKTVEELAAIAEHAHRQGQSVVLAHGVFDLVHLGHVRHLEAASREGDILIVTLTADRLVNKGPDRPVFNEEMRAEMIAAFSYVDWVAVNRLPTAVEIIEMIRPDVYIKGSDYADPNDDVTGKIVDERRAVEKTGGRIVFTRDITFSSSSLINRHLDVYEPALRTYLEDFQHRARLSELLELLESVRNYRVLLVGDAIIDEYHYVESLGKSAKENIIATRSVGTELFAGGVIAAANHVAALCGEVEVITTLGTADSREDLIRENLHENVRLTPLYREGIPTTRKCRFVEPAYVRKMFEIYFFDDTPAKPEDDKELVDLIESRANDFDVVIVTDFGHGLLSPKAIDSLARRSRFLAVNAQTNAGNKGFNLVTKYPRADYVCIDGNEARLAVMDKFSSMADIVASKLPQCLDCGKFIVTGGKLGCFTYDGTNGVRTIPAFTKMVVDTVGAGDAFLAVTAPLVAGGGDIEQVGFIGNAAGALKVGIVGHRASVEKIPLIKYLTTLMK